MRLGAMRLDGKRDLAARAVALGSLGAFFGPWVLSDHFPLYEKPESGRALLAATLAEIAGAGVTSPLEALRSGHAADAVRQVIASLWVLWLASVLLLVLVPARWTRARFVASVGAVASLAMLSGCELASGLFFSPRFVHAVSEPALAVVFAPAFAAIVLTVCAFLGLVRTRSAGLVYASAAVPFTLVTLVEGLPRGADPRWGWGLAVLFAAVNLALASLALPAGGAADATEDRPARPSP